MEIKKFRMEVNDYKFELKKMEEDSANLKVISKIEKDKEVKKYRDMYEDLKKQLK